MDSTIYGQRLFALIMITLMIGLTRTALAQSTPAEHLIGTWAMDYNRTIAQITPESKTHYDNMSQERRNRIISTFSQRKMIFQTNGNFTLELNPGGQEYGTWQLADDNTALLLSMENGRNSLLRIEGMDEGSMLLNLGGKQTRGRLFRKWYLKKI